MLALQDSEAVMLSIIDQAAFGEADASWIRAWVAGGGGTARRACPPSAFSARPFFLFGSGCEREFDGMRAVEQSGRTMAMVVPGYRSGP